MAESKKKEGNVKKLILLFLISILIFSTQANADRIMSHIGLAFTSYQTTIPDATKTWLGNHCDILIGDASRNWTLSLAANPNLLIFGYISGSGFNPSTTGDFANYIAQGFDRETAYLHYRQDSTFTGTRGSSILVSGYTAGLDPGYGAGTATALSHSRVIHPQFGSAVVTTKTINSIARSSTTVTVVTSTAHGFLNTNRITIAGVTDSGFNGSFDITGITNTTTFTYTQSGADASSSGGTATYNGWTEYDFNYKAGNWDSFYAATTQLSAALTDTGSNKLNGYFYDSILNQVINAHDVAKYKEYYDDGASNVYTWITSKLTPWMGVIKDGVTSWLAGTKTAYNCVNGDALTYAGLNGFQSFYQGTGPDIILIESGLSGSVSNPATIEPYFKNLWVLMDTYSKKVIYQTMAYASCVNVTWTLDSGAIYYSDAFNNSVPFNAFASLTAKTSKTSMTAGSYFYDSAAKRMYVWASGSVNPNTWANISIFGGEPQRLLVLSLYHVFGNHANGYFFELDAGQGPYGYQPNNSWTWFDGIAYNIGTPTTGGLKRDNSGNWTTGTDLWGTSNSTSNKPYEMWRGNSVETDDNSVALGNDHRLYARKLTNGYAIMRMKNYITALAGSNPKTFTTPFNFKKLGADGNPGPETNSFTIAQGEGVILVTNYDTPPPTIPATVSTDQASSVTTISANSGGNVTDAGGGTVSARGVCWSTSSDPTTSDSHTTNGTGTGTFVSSLTGLSQRTTYYIRAYATNEAGTAYGGNISFSTALPVVSIGAGSNTISIGAGSQTLSW